MDPSPPRARRRTALLAGSAPLVALAALTIALKQPTLTLPAYWDEMGWVQQSYWLSQGSLRRALPGLRPASAFWGHPPGLHLTLAALWKLFEPSMVVAHCLIVGFAVVGVCGTFLLGRRLYDRGTALLAALLLLLSPLYLAQSGIFLGDLPVASLGILATYLACTRRYVAYLICASYMVSIKETSIALLAAVLFYLLVIDRPVGRKTPGEALKHGVPLLLIGAFFLLQKLATGKFFFIYGFDVELWRLSPHAVWTNVVLVTKWIFLRQHRWVFTAVIVLDLLVVARARRRRELWLVASIVALSGYSFSFLYFLPRYLLPVLPFFYLLAAASLMNLARTKPLRIAAGAAAVGFTIWSLAAQPFAGNAEFNMRYVDVVRMQRAMIDHVASRFPEARTLTVWPQTAQLGQPIFGYVATPLKVTTFSGTADAETSDLILVATPFGDRNAEKLVELAGRGAWRLIERLENGAIEARLYGRPEIAHDRGD